MNKINWSAVAVFSVVALLFFLVGASLLGGWRYGSWGRMGPGMMGGWGFAPFGWAGMLLLWLLPVGLVVLIVLGIVWLGRAVRGPAAPARACSSCGRAAQLDWRSCPYCGQALV